MEIIISFDLMNGRLVRLLQGDFEQKTEYSQDPLTLAIDLEKSGVRQLHITDLDGARSGRMINHATLAAIAAHTRMNIIYGGGLRSIPSLKQAWDSGASMFSVGSVAVMALDEFGYWVRKFGPDKFQVGADLRDERIAVHGWLQQTDLHIDQFVEQMLDLGIRRIAVTDIAREGALQGPPIKLYKRLIKTYPEIQLVASGGISTVADLEELTSIGCAGALVGSAFFENSIPLHYFRVFAKAGL
ncbi:MAG: HisA/HisF-related TIM barrel protein [Saprospiraceae bacterium]